MTAFRYRPPQDADAAPYALVAGAGRPDEQRFPFRHRIEVGRTDPRTLDAEGRLLVDDPTISSMHCVVTRSADGRLYVRDSSRNGTWLDGTRLIPNREQEIRPGQTLRFGPEATVTLLEDAEQPDDDDRVRPSARSTLVQSATQVLTVLVGDVRGYTALLTSVPGTDLQAALARVFGRLQGTIMAFGGQVKEYQGDSIMAFWETTDLRGPAFPACRAALALRDEVAVLAREPDVWPFPAHPLEVHFAVATGDVAVQVLGADRPEELSLVGEAVVLAYRLEKAAAGAHQPVVTCARTRDSASDWFVFRDVGTFTLAGFAAPVQAFELVSERRPSGMKATVEVRAPGR